MNIIFCNIVSQHRLTTAACLIAASFTTSASAESNEAKLPAAHAPSHTRSQPSSPAAAKPSAPARYASPHWQLDNRYHHDRYYPARGYVVGTLPAGHIGITFGGVRYFHHGGVWFRARGPRYVVIAPPFGIVLPYLPYGYSTVWVGRDPYYYADDVYYVRDPGGYRVIAPPPATEVIVEEPVPTSVVVSAVLAGGLPTSPAFTLTASGGTLTTIPCTDLQSLPRARALGIAPR